MTKAPSGELRTRSGSVACVPRSAGVGCRQDFSYTEESNDRVEQAHGPQPHANVMTMLPTMAKAPTMMGRELQLAQMKRMIGVSL